MEVLILINPIPLVWRTILGVAALWYGWRRGGGGAAAQGENRIEFPSTERGKRQECGGLGVRRVYVRRTVCNGSITLILTMSSGNENTNSTCIRLLQPD